MRLLHILLVGMLTAVFLAPAALAASGGVIVPQVDPQPDEGYVDIYYHDCPITGSDPCSHHPVARVPLPCVDPSASQVPGGVQVRNCGDSYNVATPCVDPSYTTDLTGPYYGATASNCGDDRSVQSPCLDPDADYDTYWNWYGQVYEVYAENCGFGVRESVCGEPVYWGYDEVYVNNPYNCSPVNCWSYGWSINPGNTVTLETGNCNNPTTVTTPCADTSGTDAGRSGDDVNAKVVVCGQTYLDRTVTPPAPTAPCASAGSGGGNTVYVRVYPTCDYSDPANPQPTSTPIEREIHLGP